MVIRKKLSLWGVYSTIYLLIYSSGAHMRHCFMLDITYEPLVLPCNDLYILMFPSSVPVLLFHTMKHKLPIKNDNSLISSKGQVKWCGKYAVVWRISYIIATKHCTKAVWKIKLHSEEKPINQICRERKARLHHWHETSNLMVSITFTSEVTLLFSPPLSPSSTHREWEREKEKYFPPVLPNDLFLALEWNCWCFYIITTIFERGGRHEDDIAGPTWSPRWCCMLELTRWENSQCWGPTSPYWGGSSLCRSCFKYTGCNNSDPSGGLRKQQLTFLYREKLSL